MKILRWLITVPLALILIVFAVNNRHLVEVSLWPLDFIVHWPLFVYIYIGVLAGFLAGAVIASAAAAHRHRKARQRQSDQLARVVAAPRPDTPQRSQGAGTTSPTVID